MTTGAGFSESSSPFRSRSFAIRTMHEPDDQIWRSRASEPMRYGDLPGVGGETSDSSPQYSTRVSRLARIERERLDVVAIRGERAVAGEIGLNGIGQVAIRGNRRCVFAQASGERHCREHRERERADRVRNARCACGRSAYIAIAPAAKTAAISNPSKPSAGFIGGRASSKNTKTAAASTRFAIAMTARRRRRLASSSACNRARPYPATIASGGSAGRM